MNLIEIARLVGAKSVPEEDPIVVDIAYDSRQVTAGSLYFCRPGKVFDGHSFAEEAVKRGAVALVCERPLGTSVQELIVSDARSALNELSAHFFGDPSTKFAIAGVTGTNGKTTTTFMLHSIFSVDSHSGLIGTIETRFNDVVRAGIRTTPESVDVQRTLREMLISGVTKAAMEVTSIGLEAGRLEGTRFEVVAFTNLTRDHLLEHGSMDAYFNAKASLFERKFSNTALINVADPYGKRIADTTHLDVVSYSAFGEADLVAEDVSLYRDGSDFRAVGEGLDLKVRVHLPGSFNVANALCAIGMANRMGVSKEAIADGLDRLRTVPGRFQKIVSRKGFVVVVDYAHTPDALVHMLSAARELTTGKVIVVFGCGGDRDRSKRPFMGEAAGKNADLVIATSDNPRGEDPLAILNEVESGLKETTPELGYEIVPDRRDAIEIAIKRATSGDIVVVAGKGHETGQEFADKTVPFDDAAVVEEILETLR